MAKKPDKPMDETSDTEVKSDLHTIVDLMKGEGLDEIEIVEGENRIRIVRNSRRSFVPRPGLAFHSMEMDLPAGASAAEPLKEAEVGTPVKAPIAGVFYRSPSPVAPAFSKEGDTVQAGQPLCIIEAMKVMNEITSPVAGIVSKINVENGKPVEADQTLFLLAPIK